MLIGETALADLDHRSTIDRLSAGCVTSGGRDMVSEILSAPVLCADLLRRRAADVRDVLPLVAKVREALSPVAANEAQAAWCCLHADDMEDDERQALSSPYFQSALLEPANRAWQPMWLATSYTVYGAPALSALAPLSYVLVPFLVIRFRFGIPIGFSTFLRVMYHSVRGAGAAMNIAIGGSNSHAMQIASLLATVFMYFQNLSASISQAKALHGVCSRVCNGINSLAGFAGADIGKAWPRFDDSLVRRWLPSEPAAPTHGTPLSRVDPAVVPWSSGFASALGQYRSLDREWASRRMRRVFLADALCSIADAASRMRMTDVTFLPPGSDAVLAIRGGKRPHEDSQHPNDIAITSRANCAVVTGSNASGKSTLLRMVGCVVLLAHTTGMAPAKSCAMHPVRYLFTMMGVGDDPVNNRSRFQNELLRTGECIDAARAHPGQPGVLLMDEIFSGTDNEQGKVCGSMVLTALSHTHGCLHFLSTHHEGLVGHSLGIASSRRYRMSDGFKLSPGVNRERNAVKLFDAEI